MKKGLVAIYLFLVSMGLNAQAEFIHSQDWEAIKKMAASQEKMIFVDAYTDWCGWCKVMDKETFSDPAIGNMMDHLFINAKLEMEKDELGIKMAKKYMIASFPTYLIFNSKGELIFITTGFQEPGEFMKTLFKLLDPGNFVRRPGYSDNLNLEYPKFYDKAMGENGKRKFPKEKELNAWLDEHRDLTKEENWTVYRRFVYSMDLKYSDLFWQQLNELDTLYGVDLVNATGETILGRMVQELAKQNKEKDFEQLIAEKGPLIGIEEDGFYYKTYFYQKVNNWNRYGAIMDTFYSKKGMHNPEWWNSEAWDVYENCPDTNVIKQALKWIDEVCAISGEYHHLDTYAALLFKDNQLELAKKKAELAISTGKAGGKDVKGTEQLLSKIEEALKEKAKLEPGPKK
ncbi:MAG: DUF255 domain-containing protein [Bacteroidetes bacterium]|nr:DUF255 domain-containing protein [Bacteroidota bacterium]